MIDVKDLYEFLRVITNKAKRGSSALTPNMYNILLPRATDDFFKKYYGLPEQFQPGQHIAFEQTQITVDALKGRKVETQLTVDKNGKADYPSDYVHKVGAIYKYVVNDIDNVKVLKYPVEFMTTQEFIERLSDPIAYPTLRYPVVTMYKDYLLFAPKDIQYIDFSYLNYPNKPVLDYSIANDIIVYGPNSIDIDFQKINTNDIASLILSYIGINMSNSDLIQFAESKKQMGV